MKQTYPLFKLFFLSILTFYSCNKTPEETKEIDDYCQDSDLVYSFNYEGKNYELFKVLTTWKLGATCAVRRGGYLVEINSKDEQNAIFRAIHPEISDIDKLITDDGGGGAYVWIGANNFVLEKRWVWDGNGDNKGVNFWHGSSDGVPVDGLYNNWGINPDISTDHNGVAMAITNWDRGNAGEWNDIRQQTGLYFIVEYD